MSEQAPEESTPWYHPLLKLWKSTEPARRESTEWLIGTKNADSIFGESTETPENPNAPEDAFGRVINKDFSDASVTTQSAINLLGALNKFTAEQYEKVTGTENAKPVTSLDYLSLRASPNYHDKIYDRLTKYGLPKEKLSEFKRMVESKPPSRELSEFAYNNIVPLLKRANPHLDIVRGSTIAALASLLDSPSVDSNGQLLNTLPYTADGLDTALRHKYQDTIAVNFLTDQGYKEKISERAFGHSNINFNDPRSVLEAFSNAIATDPFVLKGIALALHRSDVLKDIPLDTYTSAQARQDYLKDLAEKEAQRAAKVFEAPQPGRTVPLKVLSAPRLGAHQDAPTSSEPSLTPRITAKELHNLAAQTLDPSQVVKVQKLYNALETASGGEADKGGVSVQQLLWQIRNQAHDMTAANNPAYDKLTIALEARLAR